MHRAAPECPGEAGDPVPCQTADPDWFFAEQPALIQQAKTVCAGCDARRSCLDAALRRGEPWGVWGGELILAGVVVASKRARGRPRKTAQTLPADRDPDCAAGGCSTESAA